MPTTLRGLPLEDSLALSWDFENGTSPQSFNGWSAELVSGTPHFAEGLHGRGVLIEEASRNLLAPTAANCSDATAFTARNGATLAVEKGDAFTSLRVRADGKTPLQGVEAKAKYSALEGDPWGAARQEAGQWAVASLEIGGQGRVAVQLLDETNTVIGAPLYLDLQPEMTRVATPPIGIVVPGGELRLRISAVDGSPLDFRMNRLQIEPLPTATSWLPGGTTRGDEALEFAPSSAQGNLQNGTLLMWVKPHWDNLTIPAMREGKKIWTRAFFTFPDSGPGVALSWSIYGTLSAGGALLGGTDMLHGGWHLIAYSWQGKNGTLYFDGHTKTTTIRPIPNNAKLSFGPRLNATLDEIALLSAPLSKEQLDAIFAAGKDPKTP
jgi:hypothetical protein